MALLERQSRLFYSSSKSSFKGMLQKTHIFDDFCMVKPCFPVDFDSNQASGNQRWLHPMLDGL